MATDTTKWPQWLKDAITTNADVEINEFGTVIWRGGVWRGGVWQGGVWQGVRGDYFDVLLRVPHEVDGLIAKLKEGECGMAIGGGRFCRCELAGATVKGSLTATEKATLQAGKTRATGGSEWKTRRSRRGRDFGEGYERHPASHEVQHDLAAGRFGDRPQRTPDDWSLLRLPVVRAPAMGEDARQKIRPAKIKRPVIATRPSLLFGEGDA